MKKHGFEPPLKDLFGTPLVKGQVIGWTALIGVDPPAKSPGKGVIRRVAEDRIIVDAVLDRDYVIRDYDWSDLITTVHITKPVTIFRVDCVVVAPLTPAQLEEKYPLFNQQPPWRKYLESEPAIECLPQPPDPAIEHRVIDTAA